MKKMQSVEQQLLKKASNEIRKDRPCLLGFEQGRYDYKHIDVQVEYKEYWLDLKLTLEYRVGICEDIRLTRISITDKILWSPTSEILECDIDSKDLEKITI